ncbi:hypothetical protein MGWOODY_Smn2140 [hydrothermal vent metagenome]|uniref:Uncharacterized protein n=1 Tax=hydrothermal vent metagenome TaxID=652676 RepID=A0A160TL45_9ZZZZ
MAGAARAPVGASCDSRGGVARDRRHAVAARYRPAVTATPVA